MLVLHNFRLLPSVLCVSRDGSLWMGFGGAGGISRIRNGVVTNYRLEDGIPARLVTAMVEDHEGAIWASSSAGLSRFRDGRWQPVKMQPSLQSVSVQALYVDRPGTLWVGSSRGILRHTAGQDLFEQISAIAVSAFSEDISGMLWTTDPRNGFRRLDGYDVGEGAASRLGVEGLSMHHDIEGTLKGTCGWERSAAGWSVFRELLTDGTSSSGLVPNTV